jgi:hypothetical protein
MSKLDEKISRYSDLLYKAMRGINVLYYNSLIDPDWKKAVGDHQKVAVTITRLEYVLNDVVALIKILNKGRKKGEGK